jgi:SAM-dependent methyltransferase
LVGGLKVKEVWYRLPDSEIDSFLADEHTGSGHPSRVRLLSLIEHGGSILDVGCGSGVDFRMITDAYPSIDYFGVDATEKFILSCRRRFPKAQRRFMHLSVYELERIGRTFDIVMCRHLLEHLPEYEIAIRKMYQQARMQLLLSFYLSPTPLRFGLKRIDKRFQKGVYTHLIDSGRLLQFITDKLEPHPTEVRIHPHLGHNQPNTKWEKYENSIYQILKPY